MMFLVLLLMFILDFATMDVSTQLVSCSMSVHV